MELHRRVCATIDLAALEDNLELLKNKLKQDTQILAVIKADGYGHGAIPMAKVCEAKDFIWGFGVAAIEEALSLRLAGIVRPIILLGFTFPEGYETIVANDITPTIFSYHQAQELSKVASKAQKVANIHIAIETGMNRIGFADESTSIEDIVRICDLSHINVEGIFTHFARADERNLEPTKIQLGRFTKFLKHLIKAGLDIPLCHCSNSAATIQLPEANMNLVRVGISMYGLYPSIELRDAGLSLTPVMSISSHITYIKTVKTGGAISYGGTYIAPRDMVVATIPVGYADGYARSLSNKGYVLIKGQRAPIIGRVCMDQLMVNISDIDNVKELDEVILLGSSGKERITMEDLSELSGRFNYEFACGISKRVPRIYINEKDSRYEKE